MNDGKLLFACIISYRRSRGPGEPYPSLFGNVFNQFGYGYIQSLRYAVQGIHVDSADELIAKVYAIKKLLALYVGPGVANVIVEIIYESVFRRV